MKKLLYIPILLLITMISCEEGGILFETDISEEEVVLLAPLDGAQVSGTTTFFDWEPLEDATTYEIQVAEPQTGWWRVA